MEFSSFNTILENYLDGIGTTLLVYIGNNGDFAWTENLKNQPDTCLAVFGCTSIIHSGFVRTLKGSIQALGFCIQSTQGLMDGPGLISGHSQAYLRLQNVIGTGLQSS